MIERKLEQLEVFEVTALLLDMAQHNEDNMFLLNAGRGNPNWINTSARLAFARLMEYGVKESQRTFSDGDLAGYIEKEDIYNRVLSYLGDDETDQFLKQCFDYIEELNLDMDEVIFEFLNGVIGNHYPTPTRILTNTEIILNEYLQSTLYNGVDLKNETDLFATEGGAAAIVYIFASLKSNKLIKPGDKIAIARPIFSPYLEIPGLNDYDMVEVPVQANEEDEWFFLPEQLDVLKDPSIKAFFVVNPSNPASKAFSPEVLAKVKEAVAANPELMIITDDVYGTFAPGFQTIYSVVPHNTLLVYSYSKMYGATGWRIGLIGLHHDNVFDKMIGKLCDSDKMILHERYSLVSPEPEKFKFIDRLCADSRELGLYHAAGLSTPQQIMEVLFSLVHLITKKELSEFIIKTRELVNRRFAKLYESLDIETPGDKLDAKYYSLIDIYQLAEIKYDKEFSQYLRDNYNRIDFLVQLSKKEGVVLIDGVGFGTDSEVLRVSFANLTDENYTILGQRILLLLAKYYKEYTEK